MPQTKNDDSADRKSKRNFKQPTKFFAQCKTAVSASMVNSPHGSSANKAKDSGSSTRPKSQQRRFRLPLKSERNLGGIRKCSISPSLRGRYSMSPPPNARGMDSLARDPTEPSPPIGRSSTARKTAGMHFPASGVRNIKDCISTSLFGPRTSKVCCSPTASSSTGDGMEEAEGEAVNVESGSSRDSVQRVSEVDCNQGLCNERRSPCGPCSVSARMLRREAQTPDAVSSVHGFSSQRTQIRREIDSKTPNPTASPNQSSSLQEDSCICRRCQYLEAEMMYLRDREAELSQRLQQTQSENSQLAFELEGMKESWKDALIAKRKTEDTFAEQAQTIARLRVGYGRKVEEIRKLQTQLEEETRKWMASLQLLRKEVDLQGKQHVRKEAIVTDTDSDISLNEFLGSCCSSSSNYQQGILSSSRNNSPVLSPRTLHDLRAENKRLIEENNRLKANQEQVQKTQEAYDRRQKLDALKQEGNTRFQQGDYIEAMKYYTQALSFAQDDARMQAVLHSNKAATLINTEKHLDAIVSSCCAISSDPSYLRAFQRRASAYESLGDFQAALQDLQWIVNSDCESSSLHREAQVKIEELQRPYKGSLKVDPYKVLGLRLSATAAEVKSQFRKLALQFHPDKTNNQEGSAEVFKLISQANSILSDESKRRCFDSARLNNSRFDQQRQN